MRRAPFGLAISISAFKQSNAGGVSPENAAQHFAPPGATWHRLPSFLMQNPQRLRQVNDWLYQRQRVSRQMLPPRVPMLRSTGEATVAAASVRTMKCWLRYGDFSIVLSAVSAPISAEPLARGRTPRNSVMPR